MHSDEVFRLSQLNQYIQQVLAINFESSFWIEAEVSQINESRGNFYLELIEKDENSDQLLATAQGRIWRSQATQIRKKIKTEILSYFTAGMKVKLRGNIKFHVIYGLSFQIDDIDLDFTLGEMERKKQETIEKLTREGIFERNKKLFLSPIVQKIAVISSRTAAGLADFVNHLEYNQHDIPFQIDIYHCAVQGTQAVPTISDALALISQHQNQYDAICILRGGGSKLDLSAFDDEQLNRMAAIMPLPILTGIGHEIDMSILDMTAHTSVKTPTALASFLIDRNLEYLDTLYKVYQRSMESARYRLEFYRNQLNNSRQKLERIAQRSTNNTFQKLNRISRNAELTAQNKLVQIRQQLTHYRTLADASNPIHVLHRGFVLASTDKKGVIKSSSEISSNEKLSLLFHDGKITTTIN